MYDMKIEMTRNKITLSYSNHVKLCHNTYCDINFTKQNFYIQPQYLYVIKSKSTYENDEQFHIHILSYITLFYSDWRKLKGGGLKKQENKPGGSQSKNRLKAKRTKPGNLQLHPLCF